MNKVITGILVLIVIVSYLVYVYNNRSNVIENKTNTVIDVKSKEETTVPWVYSEYKISDTSMNSNGEIVLLPVANVLVKNLDEKGNVSDIFTFDASGSYNPISDKTEYMWYINGVKWRKDLKFKVKLKKNTNYIVRFSIVDISGYYKIGTSVTFKIPLYDVYYGK